MEENTTDLFHDVFGEWVVSRGFWALRSPTLNPCDLCSWVKLKEKYLWNIRALWTNFKVILCIKNPPSPKAASMCVWKQVPAMWGMLWSRCSSLWYSYIEWDKLNKAEKRGVNYYRPMWEECRVSYGNQSNDKLHNSYNLGTRWR
jgi:hypothetical protein